MHISHAKYELDDVDLEGVIDRLLYRGRCKAVAQQTLSSKGGFRGIPSKFFDHALSQCTRVLPMSTITCIWQAQNLPEYKAETGPDPC
jgi:hypothetical protein